MLYSRSFEAQKMGFFVTLLEQVINGHDGYRSLVDPIIKDVHDLATQVKNYYTIDRDGYPIILYLYNKDIDYFRHLNVDNISLPNYEYILGLFSQQRNLIAA